MPVRDRLQTLTEREKQTLRLIVRGHDAKSIARSLDLSVHTINERLRDARRKMAVSSSREAARALLEAEGGDPAGDNRVGDSEIGGAVPPMAVHPEPAPVVGAGRAYRPWIIIGGFLMTFALGLMLLSALPQAAPVPAAPAAGTVAPDPAVVGAAQAWLELVDRSLWEESYRVTGASFRNLNTVQAWTAASGKARVPLGALVSRTLLSQQNLPAPPSSYEVVKFRTSFANKADAIETVTLDREDGRWRVVGVTID